METPNFSEQEKSEQEQEEGWMVPSTQDLNQSLGRIV
jgi:hypothetical protein